MSAMSNGVTDIATAIDMTKPILIDDDKPILMDHDNNAIDSFSADRPALVLKRSSPSDTESDWGLSSKKQRVDDDTDLPAAPPVSTLLYANRPTGLVYNVAMRFHVEPIVRDSHDAHPEDPRRIYEVFNELQQAGLIQQDPSIKQDGSSAADVRYLKRLLSRKATRDEILACHSERVYDWVMDLANWDETQIIAGSDNHDSIYVSVRTPQCALLAAGGAIEAGRAVMNGQVKNAIAIIRPPGHHAEHDKAMGFCFFNNVPVAVRALQNEYKDAARKVLILDWDVHHGNGVQNMFYDDPNVLYISLHVSQGGRFYPEGDTKDHLHCGAGAALGRNVNIPWTAAGMGDGDYMYAFQKVVMPIAQDFDPDVVFVCAGFDAAEGDPIGNCHVTPAGFAQMTHMLLSLADGKLVVCMEGGYNLRAVAKSATAVTKVLMGEAPGRPSPADACPGAAADIAMVLRQQARFWPCLRPNDVSIVLEQTQSVRMHDMIRAWQVDAMLKTHQMLPLPLVRSELCAIFQDHVLATPNYREDRPLLLIFHDPPDLIGIPNVGQGTLESHNTWLTDGVKSYIEWATEKGFAVIDVNMPVYFTNLERPASMGETLTEHERWARALDLASYLWENFIEVFSHPHIFFLGIGSAYQPLVDVIKQMQQRLTSVLTHSFFMITDQPLTACKSSTDERLAEWYYQHTRVYVASTHQAWKVLPRKLRFGKLIKSDEGTLLGMTIAHRADIQARIEALTADWVSPSLPPVKEQLPSNA